MNEQIQYQGVLKTTDVARHSDATPRFYFLAFIVLVAVFSRLIPHPPNFTVIGALALFSGSSFANRRVAFGVPILGMIISDLFLGYYWISIAVYLSFFLNILMGRWLANRKCLSNIALFTLVGSVQFFVVTNFACWLLYCPHSVEGLVTCYVNAIPFFQNALLGDLLYSSILFGSFAMLENKFPVLRQSPSFKGREIAAH